METETEKRMPGMPERLLDHIASESGCTIERDEDLGLVAIVFPNGSKLAGRNNTHLLIKVLKTLGEFYADGSY